MPNENSQCFCEKEEKWLRVNMFFTYKDGSKSKMCKPCLTMHIDNFDPETYLWLIKDFDVPYVPEEWNKIRDAAFAKDPKKMTGMSVFGKYLSKMKLKQWNKYSYADSDAIAALKNQRRGQTEEERQAAIAQMEVELKEKLAAGEINEAEYKTLMPTPIQHRDMEEAAVASAAEAIAPADLYAGSTFPEDRFVKVNLPDPTEDLTEDDIKYLVMKWGKLYSADELLALEQDYKQMTDSFEVTDADTKNSLTIICKLNLKANQALDAGDYDGFSKLNRALSEQRKLANFAALQRKKDAKIANFVDSIGELVAYCEKNGGAIPPYDLKTPLDKVDVIIQDMKEYTKTLIYEDTALAAQIEDYLKRREILAQQKKDKEAAKEQGLDSYQVTDDDIADYEEHVRQLKSEDALLLQGGSDEDGLS